MARFVELAAKYGFTDDGQSIDGWEEDAGLDGDPPDERDERDKILVSNDKTKKGQQANRVRVSSVQRIRKVAPQNHLSSIEVLNRTRIGHIRQKFLIATFEVAVYLYTI